MLTPEELRLAESNHEFKLGAILRGIFPVHDSRKHAQHYALVIGHKGRATVGLVGTSVKTDERLIRPGNGLLLISPRTAGQHWSATGLVKPTIFDLLRGMRFVLPEGHTAGRGRVTVEGTVESVGCWLRLTGQHGRAVQAVR